MAVSGRSAPGEVTISSHVRQALESGAPVVALESAVITHGLPHPTNLDTANQMQAAIAAEGATPAAVAVLGGKILVGITMGELQELAAPGASKKISMRDIPLASVQKLSGGTTVAATMFAASVAGIRVFATGGIGGVHRQDPFDVSADLEALAQIPMIVVCAGAKAILDLRATLERLETLNVPVIGYRTNEFPAFYSRSCGLATSGRLDSPREIAEFWFAQQALQMQAALLVANPIPEESAIPHRQVEDLITQASRDAKLREIHGQALTPFLLERLGKISDGRTMRANVALLLNNARLAAQIAVALAHHRSGKERS